MQEFGKPLLYAILVHLGLLVLMIVGTWDWKKFQPPRLAGLNIEAVVVNSKDLNQKVKRVKAVEHGRGWVWHLYHDQIVAGWR